MLSFRRSAMILAAAAMMQAQPALTTIQDILYRADGTRFNEFHALIVNTGRNYCRSREPLCDQCPLGLHRKEGR